MSFTHSFSERELKDQLEKLKIAFVNSNYNVAIIESFIADYLNAGGKHELEKFKDGYQYTLKYTRLYSVAFRVMFIHDGELIQMWSSLQTAGKKTWQYNWFAGFE